MINQSWPLVVQTSSYQDSRVCCFVLLNRYAIPNTISKRNYFRASKGENKRNYCHPFYYALSSRQAKVTMFVNTWRVNNSTSFSLSCVFTYRLTIGSVVYTFSWGFATSKRKRERKRNENRVHCARNQKESTEGTSRDVSRHGKKHLMSKFVTHSPGPRLRND